MVLPVELEPAVVGGSVISCVVFDPEEAVVGLSVRPVTVSTRPVSVFVG